MFDFLVRWLEPCRRVIASTHKAVNGSGPAKTITQDQLMEACAQTDTSQLIALLDEWHRALFIHTAESGSAESLQHLLDRYGIANAPCQTMLEQAAEKGNVATFRMLLQQEHQIRPIISLDVRMKAVAGGLEIWWAIYDHQPKLIQYRFGHHGNLLSLATRSDNPELVQFCLEHGMDPNSYESGFLGVKPIMVIAAEWPSIRPEILDLLVKYGATKEKSWPNFTHD